ncbi:hypothetical protein BDR07DRAFT_1424465 [Suillus spraguei]|nr:hypothetical protein BDR07DRAFT_1424465 [Suillus spraguei]
MDTSASTTTIVTTEVSTTTSIPVPTSSPSPSSLKNSPHTGAIVGAIIAGIAGIALPALLIFYIRRRRRRDQFGGKFDPDRIISHSSRNRILPQVDLGEENEITHYPDSESNMSQFGESPFQPSGAGGASTHRRNSPFGSPSQYSARPNSAGTGYSSQGFINSAPGQHPQGAPNMHQMQHADQHHQFPITSPAPIVTMTPPSSSHTTKEIEAAGRQGLGLATQQEVDGEGSGVVQHQDGGRVHSEEEGEPRDIPPAYDSIRQ